MSQVSHGPQSLADWMRWARRKVRNDDDVVIAVTGNTGAGKSSLSVLLANALQDQPLDVRRQFFWHAEAIPHAARSLPEFSVLVLDEAVSANRRQAMTTANKELMTYLNICRTFHHVVIFAIPQFDDLDVSIQTRCSWVFHCNERGRFTAQEVFKAGREAYPVDRFEDVFPDPAVRRPRIWQRYLDAKRAYSYQGDDPKGPIKNTTREAYATVVRSILTNVRGAVLDGVDLPA